MAGRLATSFSELEVYQRTRAVASAVFEATKVFPREEAYALTDQLRRSSRSIGAQIAEAWAKRWYPRHFRSKLSDADAEQLEAQHWVGVALDCGYLESKQAEGLLAELGRIGRMLNSMMEKARLFSREAGHDDAIQVSRHTANRIPQTD